MDGTKNEIGKYKKMKLADPKDLKQTVQNTRCGRYKD